MQTQNKFFDDIARVAGGALGAIGGLKEEIERMVHQVTEKALSRMDMVSREEFEAVKAMASQARMENEALAARLAELESCTKAKPTSKPRRKSPAPRKTSTTNKTESK